MTPQNRIKYAESRMKYLDRKGSGNRWNNARRSRRWQHWCNEMLRLSKKFSL
jgi:hypothetical protein